MKRREMLIAAGVGALSTGAIVGTGSYSRVRSQRRVKIEVEDDDEFVDNDRAAISHIAFCILEADWVENTTHDDFTVTPNLFKDEDEPVGVAWESPVPVQTVVLFGGGEFFNFIVGGATSNEVEMGERNTGSPSNAQHPSTPCADVSGTCSVKFNWEDDEFVPDFPQDSCIEEP